MEKDPFAEGVLCVTNFILELTSDHFADTLAFQVGIV